MKFMAPKTNGGDFGLAAEVSQRLKAGIEWAMTQGADPTAVQKEATDMICTALGHIYAGDASLLYWSQIMMQADQIIKHMEV